MRVRAIAAVMAAGALLATAACSSDSGSSESGSDADSGQTQAASDGEASGEITFVWWGNDDRADRFNQSLDLFVAEYPDISVIRNFTSWGDYWTARNTEAAGRALPDVFMMDVGYIGQYASNGLFLDMSGFEGNLIDLDGYSDTLVGSGTVGGELVGIPLGSGVWSMMYNKDMLDSLGLDYPTEDMTWADFNAWSEQVNEAGAGETPSLYGAEDYTGNFPAFIYYLMQQGNEVFTAEGDPAFTKEDVVAFLETGASMREGEVFFPVERSAALSPSGGFNEGEVATWFNWSTTVLQGMTDLGTENLGMVTPPLEEGESAHVLSEKASMLLSIAANTENPDAAATLVNFLANSPEVAEIFGTSLGTPATRERRDAVQQNAADTVNITYLEEVGDQLSATYPLLPAGYGSVEAKWAELHERMRYGDMDEAGFADELWGEMELAFE